MQNWVPSLDSIFDVEENTSMHIYDDEGHIFPPIDDFFTTVSFTVLHEVCCLPLRVPSLCLY